MKVFILSLLSVLAVGQVTRPEFEVASIKPSAEQATAQVEAGIHIDGAQVRCVAFSVKDYILMAYKLKGYQLIGPDWMASQRFDINAKLPEGTTQAQVPEMVQSLLADRFKMKMHHESREFPVYALEVAKSGFKLTPAADDGQADTAGKGGVNVAASGSAQGVSINLGNGSYFSLADNRFEAKKLTMTILVDSLSRFANRPILNMTNLEGRYDFSLELSPEDYRGMLIQSGLNAGVMLPPIALRALELAPGDSLGNAFEKVGLQLQPRKAPLDVVVIDNILKVPTDN